MKFFLLILLLLWIIISCNHSKNNEGQSANYKYELETAADKDLKYPIGNDIKFLFGVLFPYIDKSGKEYLTFRSLINNSILFYDLLTGKYLFDVKLDKEGPNGIGRCTGYYIEDLDNIYITSYEKFGLVKVDTTATIKQFIAYGKTDNGYNVVPSYTSKSYPYQPIVFYDRKIYITQKPYQASKISETPVSVAIDTVVGVIAEHPFRFPNLLTDDELRVSLIGLSFSRDFNGKQLVYSFHIDENIYVTDMETEAIKKIPVRSKYVNSSSNSYKLKKYPETSELASKMLLETSCYRNLFYDKYRNVYYRFTQIGIEQRNDTGITPEILWESGPAQFSVIILDKDFNIIGETLFPKYKYNPTVVFVHKNGLYISDSHILNPSFDENVLSFECFTLKEIKK
jgi:hypothetical protein